MPGRPPSDRPSRTQNKPLTGVCAGQGLVVGGRYWDRTSDLFRVREARYRCANRPCCWVLLEVETGFEPVYAALQAAASPLGHSTILGRLTLRADDRARTGDLNLGKVALYQLSYIRMLALLVLCGIFTRCANGETLTDRRPHRQTDPPATGLARQRAPCAEPLVCRAGPVARTPGGPVRPGWATARGWPR